MMADWKSLSDGRNDETDTATGEVDGFKMSFGDGQCVRDLISDVSATRGLSWAVTRLSQYLYDVFGLTSVCFYWRGEKGKT